jgi:nitrilase
MKEKITFDEIEINMPLGPREKEARNMAPSYPHVKVAVVQAGSVIFNREATIEKGIRLIREAAQNGARFVLFPEAFIPAYPRGLSFGMFVGGRSHQGLSVWRVYWENSIDVPGPETEVLGAAAQENRVYLAIGVIERDSSLSRGTLYCTLLYFGPDGTLLGKHRKLKPTGGERLVWGEGDGSTLTVIDTDFGRVGGLICWENYMPLARTAMYAKGVEIYLAPTADARTAWQSTLQHIACEGRCFVLGCNQFVTKDMYPKDMEGLEELNQQPEIICRGGSSIISPRGKVLSGPLYGKEEILLADLDMAEVVNSKLDFDAVGHYSRPDIFQLTVNEEPLCSVRSAPR